MHCSQRDWNEFENSIMLKAQRAKVLQSPECYEKLKATGNLPLFCTSDNDSHWGARKNTETGKFGRNAMGAIMMSIRTDLNDHFHNLDLLGYNTKDASDVVIKRLAHHAANRPKTLTPSVPEPKVTPKPAKSSAPAPEVYLDKEAIQAVKDFSLDAYTQINYNACVKNKKPYKVFNNKTADGFELSSFYVPKRPFKMMGYDWKSAEHFVQATRFKKDSEHFRYIQQTALSPQDAVDYANKHENYYTKDVWDKYKDRIMLKAQRASVLQSEEFYEKLKDTKDLTIFCTSDNDSYWGIGETNKETGADGRNTMGAILMRIRKDLMSPTDFDLKNQGYDLNHVSEEVRRLLKRDIESAQKRLK